MQYGHLSISPQLLSARKGICELMLDRQAFVSILKSLDAVRQTFPVIVIEMKPTCLKCGEISHLSPSCPEKEASEVLPNLNKISL